MNKFSVYLSGRKAGDVGYVERGPSKLVQPLGLLYEPKYQDAAQYTADTVKYATQSIVEYQKQGVEQFVLNTEGCWANVPDGAGAVNAALLALRSRFKGVGGAYGAFVSDFVGWEEPHKGKHDRNLFIGDTLDGVTDYVEIDGYAERVKLPDGRLRPRTINGSAVAAVVMKVWHAVQQARMMSPFRGVRVWLSTQCLNNGLEGPATDLDVADFQKITRMVAALPGVTAMVHFAERDQNAVGNVGGGLELTATRAACRAVFADSN